MNILRDELSRYIQRDSFWMSLQVLMMLTLTAYLLGQYFRNYSMVDRLWSICPAIYGWIFIVLSEEQVDIYQIIMTVLISVWAIRLSYNFKRRGGYNLQYEDYRWQVIKQQIDKVHLWWLFHILFIAIFQMSLLWAITLPIFISTLYSQNHHKTIHKVLSLLMFIIFLFLESLADQQQFQFYSNRTKKLLKKEKVIQNFNIKGLFKYCRHPNFISEQCIWISVYLFGVSYSHQWFNSSLIGVLSLIILFYFSTRFTEQITLSKYPQYKLYQDSVDKFIPVKYFLKLLFNKK